MSGEAALRDGQDSGRVDPHGRPHYVYEEVRL